MEQDKENKGLWTQLQESFTPIDSNTSINMLKAALNEYYKNRKIFGPPKDTMIVLPIEAARAIFGAINIEVYETETTKQQTENTTQEEPSEKETGKS